MTVSSTYQLPAALVRYCEKSTIALTVAAADKKDEPLVLANEAFLDLIGYGAAEVLDRNCRFLQGEETDAASRHALSAFIHDDDADAERFRVTNHRKDGTTFENFLFMSRLRDKTGETRLFLGAQFDLTKAARRSEVVAYNTQLQENISDISAVSQGFGLAMMDSAAMISQSIAMLASIAFQEG